ncbi:MAG: septation protein SpoVG family protein [Candidatus Omnitrophica bacterium]|nr:septation protein SpoVG family protein [Candidatus Omnitrophota bacterium]
MEITEVKVFLKEGQDKKLKAYATLTFDNQFVVRNVKVIEGSKGLFVAMPSRKLKESCPKCSHKNVIRSRFCNQCGVSLGESHRSAGVSPGLPEAPARTGDEERQAEHKDIAHPITLECREYIQKKVLEAYEAEKRKGPHPSPSNIEGPSN